MKRRNTETNASRRNDGELGGTEQWVELISVARDRGAELGGKVEVAAEMIFPRRR
jgi:hypothetical protein